MARRRTAVDVVVLAGLALAGLLVPSCRPSTTGDVATPAPTGVTIGVSLLTRIHPFYQELEAGLQAEAAARGFRLDVQSGEFDVARQKDQLESFIVSHVAAIVVSPCDSHSIGTSIQAANRAGIPVFTADIAVLAPGVRVVSHVASDHLAGGQLAAQALAHALAEEGEVAIIDHPEVESVIERVRGFEEELATHPGVQLVAKLSGRGMKDTAFRAAEDLLQAHPLLDGIFAVNNDTALGALAAVERAGRLGRVAIVSFDAMPEARRAIAEGKIVADVVQQPRAIGEETVKGIAAYLAGSEVEPVRLIPCQLFTRGEALAGE